MWGLRTALNWRCSVASEDSIHAYTASCHEPCSFSSFSWRRELQCSSIEIRLRLCVYLACPLSESCQFTSNENNTPASTPPLPRATTAGPPLQPALPVEPSTTCCSLSAWSHRARGLNWTWRPNTSRTARWNHSQRLIEMLTLNSEFKDGNAFLNMFIPVERCAVMDHPVLNSNEMEFKLRILDWSSSILD